MMAGFAWTKPKPRVIVCGSREFDDEALMDAALKDHVPYDATLVNGGCRGADKLAEKLLARRARFNVVTYEADWKTHGQAAGPIRNRQMLDEEKPELVLAFYKAGAGNMGTKNMVALAKAAGVRVVEFTQP